MWDQSNLVFPKCKRQDMCEHLKRRSKRGMFELGGVWMMVRGSNFVNFCKIMLVLLVLS
jgi:hypothetical protein